MSHLFFSQKTSIIPNTYFITIAFCILLSSCSINISTNALSGSTGPTSIGSGVLGVVQVFVEPNAGDHIITNAIANAKKSVWLEMYLLTDRNVIRALEETARRGVDVRVMLEAHPYGSGSSSATETLDRLRAARISAQSTNPSFALTHEKGMIVDDRTAYIMTANFTLSALGGTTSTTNREYGIIDSNLSDVQAVADIFQADWSRTNAHFNDPNLVVSPINSRNAFTSLISRAHSTLLIEAEEMNDTDIEHELMNATQHGVHVQVILPAPADASGDSNSGGIQTIRGGGVQVKEDPRLYMHAKVIIVDGQAAFVGSENISAASLDQNRELGIIVSDANVLNTLQQTFLQDWKDSRDV
jgi:cardiolipin synthase A/B